MKDEYLINAIHECMGLPNGEEDNPRLFRQVRDACAELGDDLDEVMMLHIHELSNPDSGNGVSDVGAFIEFLHRELQLEFA